MSGKFYLFLVLYLIFNSTELFSLSPTDSLIGVYNNTNNSHIKYKILGEIIELKFYNLEADNSIYLHKAFEIAKKENNKEKIADMNLKYAKYLKIFGYYSKSYEYLHYSEEYYKKTNNKSKLASTYLGFGETYRVSSDLVKSIEVLIKAEKIYKELKDTLGLAKAYNQIASVKYEFKNRDDFENAINYAKQSLKLIENYSNTMELQISNLNIIGSATAALGEYKTGEYYLNEALRTLTPELEKVYKPLILIHLSQTCYARNDYKSALNYGLASYYSVKKSGLKLYLFWIESILSDLYADIGNFEKAYFFRNESNNHYGEIYNEKQRTAMLRIKFDYEKRLEDKEIQKEIVVQRHRLYSILLFAVFLTGLLILLYSRQRTLKKKNIQISETNEMLNELVATKDKFFSIIAHDLKGPVSAFSSSMNMLKKDFDKMDDNEKKEFIYSIDKSSKILYKLLENLLTWSMSQRGIIRYEPSDYNLSYLTGTAVAFVSNQSGKKNIEIISNVNPEINVYVDENTIITTFRNLLSNAIKFSYSGSKVFINANYKTAEKDKIEYAEITLEDKGTGIEEDKLSKLFNLRTSTSNSGTEGELGTGLGLVLCKEFIEKNGGTIRVESKINKGTRFIITLPLSRARI
ncbi:MAG: tetratricopeptide repeat-containing sensor histidine kinase [Ignavibacteriae bacterium]|nr:tetratricopeptide repeat-containing sensor histidine kinase [Ignavibacteriota bacterium]